jgi:4,5-DOPA dioxygenase extradiol
VVNVVKKMPTLFVGHGTPMNAIEDNEYSKTWTKIADALGNGRGISLGG